MPQPDDKSERLKTPPGFEEHPTPVRPLSPGGEPDLPQDVSDEVLRPLRSRYENLLEIGRGGMGVVYRAKDKETGDRVALKVLRPEIASRGDAVERFKEELRLARRITHKSVCRTYELLRFGDTVVIAMEYLEGESLRAILKRFGGVPLRRGLEWARQICSALAEAHAQGIVHRDLKPENIFIDHDGDAKVMDFGIARSVEGDLTQTGTLLGTPAYMSPEQVEGKPLDPRSDIYSLGLILYEMFTGHVAFQADTASALALKRLQEAPPAPRDLEPYLPSFLERVLLRCVEKDPAKRFQTMTELEAALGGREEIREELPRGELPVHLSGGQKSDAVLLGVGVLGLLAFLSLADRVVPEATVSVRVTPRMLMNNAREEVMRRGWTPTSRPLLLVHGEGEPYRYLAERSGYEVARRRLAEFPPLLYEIQFPKPEKPDDAAASVWYEPGGALRKLWLPVVGWVPAGPGLPRDEALSLAEREIRRACGVDVTTLQREHEGTLSEEGRSGHSFRWIHVDPSGIRWRYQANVFDRVTLFERTLHVPEDYRPRPLSPSSIIAAVAVWAAALLFFVARRVFLQIRWPEALSLASVAFVAGFGISLGNRAAPVADIAIRLVNMLVFGLVLLAWIVVLYYTVFSLAVRRWPQWVMTSSALVGLRPAPRPTGLALLRGVATGLLLLGIQGALLRMGTAFAHAPVPLPDLWPTFVSSVPSLTMLGFVLISTTAATLLPALGVVVVGRLTRQPALMAAVGGALYALVFASNDSGWFFLVTTFLIGALLSCSFVLFDLLTLAAAAFTLTLVPKAYTLIRMFEPVGNSGFWFLIVAWGAVFAWAVFAGFRPLWEQWARRLSEAFD